MAVCENDGCGAPAELQCGRCSEMYLCKENACFNALHRAPDRAVHRKSMSAYGTASLCAHEADLTKRRTAAEEECCVLEGLGVRCKDHLQQTVQRPSAADRARVPLYGGGLDTQPH